MSVSRPPSAVVDTNVFVSGTINLHGRPRQVLLAWLEGRFDLILSEQQYDELTSVFERPKIARLFRVSQDEQIELIARLASTIHVTPSYLEPIAVRDPKDEHILAAAIDGNAEFLVTGDNDLLTLADDPRLGPLKIVTVAQFLDAISWSKKVSGRRNGEDS